MIIQGETTNTKTNQQDLHIFDSEPAMNPNYEAEEELLRAQRQTLEKERNAYTEATLKLGRERESLLVTIDCFIT